MMELIIFMFAIVLFMLLYVGSELSKIRGRMNAMSERLDDIYSVSSNAVKLEEAIGDDLVDIGEFISIIRNNVDITSAIIFTGHISHIRIMIKQLIDDDRFEEAKSLKENLNTLIKDFKAHNPNISIGAVDYQSGEDINFDKL